MVDTVDSLVLYEKGRRSDLGVVGRGGEAGIARSQNRLVLPQMKLIGYSIEEADRKPLGFLED